jgi:hypothetical protein
MYAGIAQLRMKRDVITSYTAAANRSDPLRASAKAEVLRPKPKCVLVGSCTDEVASKCVVIVSYEREDHEASVVVDPRRNNLPYVTASAPLSGLYNHALTTAVTSGLQLQVTGRHSETD